MNKEDETINNFHEISESIGIQTDILELSIKYLN